METPHRSDPSRRGSTVLGVAVGMLLIGGAFIASHKVFAGSANAASVAPAERSPELAVVKQVEQAANEVLARKITLKLGAASHVVTWAELGAVFDPIRGKVVAEAGGDDLPGHLALRLDPGATAKALEGSRSQLDTGPIDARMDLEGMKIHEATAGLALDGYGSVALIERGLAEGAETVELIGVELAPRITVKELGIDDISHELASFKTRFSISERTRNANLKLAASKLNGHVLQPGVEFSFNGVVGERTEKEGYKIAHVITAGQMVDGLAGGACQISTTLHGAAFFAGIGITNSIPHSRPSTYVQMGLDATVWYPHVDLKLKNRYDFPVVIHYRVARGEAEVRILGRERPYDKIAFEREVKEELEFDTITREDQKLPVGSMVVEQNGFFGYKLERWRKFYRKGKLVKKEKWNLRYRPVTEYVRLGINPDPNLPPPKQGRGHGPRAPKKLTYRITQ